MPYYDPQRWIPADDQLDGLVEQKLISHNRTSYKATRSGKSFSPLGALELDVLIGNTSEILRLTEWIEKDGKVCINLGNNGDMFRKGHFKHAGHHNPNCQRIPPPNHVHFPTMKYRDINKSPSYAHPVSGNSDYITALTTFCDCTNIVIQGARIPYLSVYSR